MSKGPQPPLRGMFGKRAVWSCYRHRIANGRGIDVHEEWPTQKIPISMKNLDFMIFWLVSCLEENVKFDKFLIRYISNVLNFKLYFRNKISIYNVFNMLLTNIWYSLSSIFMNCHFLENNIK